METFNNFEKINLRKKNESCLVGNSFKLITEKPIYSPEAFSNERNVSMEKLRNYFEENNFLVLKPIPLKLENATTLFVSAGIQILEDVIHKEKDFPSTPIFVNQPVLRSQFLGSTAIESHTAFHNITTIDINIDIDTHINHLEKWLKCLFESGFARGEFEFQLKETTPKIGNIKYTNLVTKIFYSGLEIGDAVFIPSIPQNTRPNFSISDIGFGLERLQHNPLIINTTEKDCLKTLALLALSGIKPGNNNHGYRFRMFSKKFVSECNLDYLKLVNILKTIPELLEFWGKSAAVSLNNENEAMDLIILECERNFNREILNFLKENYEYHNEININQKTKSFMDQLIKIGDKSSKFWDSLETKLKINF